MPEPEPETCKCGWLLPSLTLEITPAPAEPRAPKLIYLLVCCPGCDVFIKVSVDVPPASAQLG